MHNIINALRIKNSVGEKEHSDAEIAANLDKVLVAFPNLNDSRAEIRGILESYESFMFTAMQIINKQPPRGEFLNQAEVLLGIMFRALDFYHGALVGLGLENKHVVDSCIRAQIETLALVVYCSENPNYWVIARAGYSNKPNNGSFKLVHVHDQIKVATKKYPELFEFYESLCAVVHPTSASLNNHFATLQVKRDDLWVDLAPTFTFKRYFSKTLLRQVVDSINDLAKTILAELEQLTRDTFN